VTVYGKNLTSQCNLVAQIEQVQDKVLFMTILLMIGSGGRAGGRAGSLIFFLFFVLLLETCLNYRDDAKMN
jgi:hypothetical protein